MRVDPRFEASRGHGWWFRRWAGPRVRAGVTDRHTDLARLLCEVEPPVTAVEAEQVHGGSVAVIERADEATLRLAPPRRSGVGSLRIPPHGQSPWGSTSAVPGADALVTRVPGIALCVRSADCVPIFVADPPRGVVGIAHAGWRGVVASLPARVISVLRHAYHSRASDLQIAIGPAIRVCCYEVGPEFAERFGPFVQERDGRRTCDLVGVARAQLLLCGVRPDRVLDSGRCTACEAQHWFSLRREGPSAGRLTSLILLRP